MTAKKLYCIFFIISAVGWLSLGCTKKTTSAAKSESALIVLGTVQDAGSPHIACRKSCCAALFDTPNPDRQVTALGIFDASTRKKYLFEASPNMPQQLKKLKSFGSAREQELPDGIFLTHAHIGHYAGLMYLGKEATNSSNIPVYAMPKMRTYLSNNGPWSQLVETNNIKLMPLGQSQTVSLSKELEVTPFLVPHRDEYSETVGYKIKGPNKTALFIPDIDKWEKWETAIVNAVKQVDYAFLDATFYSGAEMNFRDISEIPHPFIIETMALFKDKPKTEKNKLIFIHLNHTNPALDPLSTATKEIEKSGFQVARINQVFTL